MILFKKLRWKNALASGNQFIELTLDSHATTLILGKNGSGKSTILDALCYALFKKPFRKINKDLLVNNINNGDCVFEVEFDIGTIEYKVVRGIKPDILELYINGKLREKEAAKKDDQAYLSEDILKVGYESFLQVVILGNAKYVPFMQLPGPKRRDFIEDILDIGVFSTMNTVLGKRQKALKGELDGIDKDILSIKEKVSLVEGFIVKIKEEANRANDEILSKIALGNSQVDEMLAELQTLNDEICSLEETISDYQKVSDKIQKLNAEEQRGMDFIKAAEKKITFYQSTEKCKVCEQDISEVHKENILTSKQAELDQFTGVLETIRSKRTQLKLREKSIRDVQKQIQAVRSQENEKNSQVRATRTYVKKLEQDLQKQPGNVEEQETKLKVLENKLLRLAADKDDAVERRHFYDVAAVLLKDTGIKAAIIKQYLPVINKLVNQYLDSFQFYLSLSLDEGFEESFNSRLRDKFSYYSFSEGEKLRIDLALLFTWRDIARMKNSCSTNLLILDEVIDKSLDVEGTDFVIQLFNELGKTSNVVVISHKQDASLDMFARTVKFEIQSNFSKMVSTA